MSGFFELWFVESTQRGQTSCLAKPPRWTWVFCTSFPEAKDALMFVDGNVSSSITYKSRSGDFGVPDGVHRCLSGSRQPP